MVKIKNNQMPPPIVKLNYKKGELIIKQGDYGTSIYQIIKGQVQVFTHSDDKEILLSLRGPGDIIGETAFLSEGTETRSASARAIQDSVLEVWHPDLLSREYDKMPPIIKYITDESLNRLFRMNRLVVQMTSHKAEETEEEKTSDEQQSSRRRHYRKDVDFPCTYRPVDSSSGISLKGKIKNISLTGVNIEVRGKNATNFSHDPGDEFHIKTTLPGGKDVHLTARILSFRKPRLAGMLSLGMVFTDMREGTNKKLGFFLMP